MFFSLHSMTCSISSLGGDYVRRGFCPTENRRGFCPGGLLSGGILSRGDFVLDSLGPIQWRRPAGTEFGGDGKLFRGPRFLNDSFSGKNSIFTGKIFSL